MFVYSLAGLQIDGEASQEMELPDNEITARLAVYQSLARLMTCPDADAYSAAVQGEWPARLAHDTSLLPYSFDFGTAAADATVSEADFQAEYLRLFEVGSGPGGPAASLFGGVYGGGDRMKKLEEVVRFYEYFGLKAAAEDPRPADHVATELEFMKFLTFKEATSSSPRLRASFRRAQQDFLDRQLNWLPELLKRTEAQSPMPFWQWAVGRCAAFAEADAAHLTAVPA